MAATRLLFSLALVQRLGHRETGRREHGASVDAGIQRQRAWIWAGTRGGARAARRQRRRRVAHAEGRAAAALASTAEVAGRQLAAGMSGGGGAFEW